MKTSNCRILSSEKSTFDEAQKLRDSMSAATVAGCPLRYRPVVIHGPNDGFMVAELGFATANEMPVIRA